MEPSEISWSRIHYQRNSKNYELLINICYFVLDGMLQTTEKGEYKMVAVSDEHMSRLYEKFILEYYHQHHTYLTEVKAGQVKWDLVGDSAESMIRFLPIMQTDIMLRLKERILIIDAKYYGQTLQKQFDKYTLHSGNVYQIFTYVKNQDKDNTGNVAGILLYAKTDEDITPDCMFNKGKRLIISSEMEEGMRLNTAVVKQLCSTDEIQAEKKYKDPFSFVPSHTLVLYTNHLPKVGANDDGIWRRLIVIPFNAKITGKSDIKNYADYLFEHAGPAIMSWIIEGAKKAIDKDFRTDLPDVVEAAIKAYREDNDWLGQFLEECCEIDSSYKAKSGELYQAYRAHCMQNGEYIRSTTDFYSAMDKAGYNRIRKNTGVQVVGLKLKEGQDFLG